MLPEHFPPLASTPRRKKTCPDGRFGDHLLQLFDTDESLAASVAEFMATGAIQGETLGVICTREHWRAIQCKWPTEAPPTDVLSTIGQLTVLEADRLLVEFMRRGQPSEALFSQSVGTLVEMLANRPSAGLRLYGEMVELLARDGNYSGAAQLEAFWNALARQHRFTLLCGYSSAHFAAPDGGSTLSGICDLHSRVIASGEDPLGHYLLHQHDHDAPA